MKTLDWRNPESEDAKREMIGRGWESMVNTYLWYEMRDRRDLVVREGAYIRAKHFTEEGKKVKPGDIECRRSQHLPGQPWLLRLRGELVLLPAVIVGAFYFPLYQFGGADEIGRTSPGYINFWKQMDPNARASSGEV